MRLLIPKEFNISGFSIMSLSVSKLDAPEIQITKMLCDGVLSKKLIDYPMIHTCFNRSNFTIFAGGMGRGKSSTVVSLLKNVFRKCFHTIYFIIPEGSRMSIDGDFLGKNIPPDQLFGEISVEIYNLNEKFEYLDGFLRRIELDKLLKEKEKTNGN